MAGKKRCWHRRPDTVWVRMVRRAGSRIWYMRLRPAASRNGKPHPNLDVALIEMEVLPGRVRDGVWLGRAALARKILGILAQRGRVPRIAVGAKRYRLPLQTTRSIIRRYWS